MICEPPKPRLMTRCFGKSSASVVQRRMLELPMNSAAPVGGGLVLSAASKARISFSKGAALVAAARGGGVGWAGSGAGANQAIHRPASNSAAYRMWDESLIPALEASLSSTTNRSTMSESVFEKWVARATRPFRSATRRPERARLSPAEGSPYSLPMRSPFRPASRRTAQASGLCYPKRNFQTRSEAGEVARPTTAGAGGVACPTNGGKRIRWWNALPLLGLPVVATLATWRAPAWLLMWSVAFALFAGIKWLMWRDANATPAGVGRTLGFLTLWPGMHARRFLAPA